MSQKTDAVNADLVPLVAHLIKKHDAAALSACLLNEAMKLTLVSVRGDVKAAEELTTNSVTSWYRDLAPLLALVLNQPLVTPKKDIH